MSESSRWQIPTSWTWATPGAFAQVVGGGTPSNAKDPNNYSKDGTPWITPADLSGYTGTYINAGRRNLSDAGFASSSARILPKGSVLLSSRAPVGYCAIAANDLCTNQGFKSLVLASLQMQPEYLRYYLLGSKAYLESQASGTTFLELSGERVRELLFPIAPHQEQARIVSKLDELFSRIDAGERALERVRVLVERYRQSVLKAAVTGELTREWREQHAGELESGEALLTRILHTRRQAWEQAELAKMAKVQIRPASEGWKRKYRASARPELVNLCCLPIGWAWTTLPTLCTDETANGISVKGSSMPPGFPALRLDAMTATGFDYSAIRYIPITQQTADRLSVAEGDFFVSRANGTLRLVGRAVLASRPETAVVFPDTMIRDRPLSLTKIGAWLQVVWSSPLIRRQLERRAKTTAGIHKISQEDISSVAIPLPSQREQDLICSLIREHLAQADHALRETLIAKKLSAAAKRAILRAAFSGQLVPQDPTDEPASVLLERIAAERAAAFKRAAKRQPKRATAKLRATKPAKKNASA